MKLLLNKTKRRNAMKLHIMDRTGDRVVDIETETDLAKTLFEEAIRNGKMAYAVTDSGNYVVTEFESIPSIATKVIIRPVYVGG